MIGIRYSNLGMVLFIGTNYKWKQDVFVKHNAPDHGQFHEGQDHKDKYFDTSRKILSQEMIMYNMEAFSILSLRSYDQCQFFF